MNGQLADKMIKGSEVTCLININFKIIFLPCIHIFE